jgi:tetratricopeptide (TPR) repeat protein
LYIACDKYPQAIDTFNTAILIHPDNSHYEDHELEQLMHAGQAYEALNHLEQLCQDQPERADLSLRYADVLSMMGDDDRAVSQYQQALSLCPDFLEATIKLGTHYLRMQKPKLAAKQFNRAVDINDRIVEAYIGLALAQKFAANTNEALTTLSLAAAIQPNSSLLFAETATLQFRAGFQGPLPLQTVTESTQLMQAVIDAHRRQITERPHNADLHYRLGLLLTSICRPDAAINAFRTALTINPAYSRARSKLGLSIFEVGRHEQALNELANVPAVTTETLALHYKTALLYADKIRFASSLLNLERKLAENFTTSDASVNISIVLQNLGLLDRATATWDSLAATTNEALQSFYGPAPGQC